MQMLSHPRERIALDHDDEHSAYQRADCRGHRKANQRRTVIPWGSDVDAVSNRKTIQLHGEERLPERTRIADPQNAGNAGVDRGDQKNGLPIETESRP